MTLPVWPATVPYEVQRGWQMPQMYVAPLSTDMDGGNQRLRSRPGSNVAVVDYPLEPMTEAEWLLFNQFVRTTLNNGASRFTMSVFVGGGAYFSKTVQFEQGQSPQIVQSDDLKYRVTLKLRIYGLDGTIPAYLKFNSITNSQYLGAM